MHHRPTTNRRLCSNEPHRHSEHSGAAAALRPLSAAALIPAILAGASVLVALGCESPPGPSRMQAGTPAPARASSPSAPDPPGAPGAPDPPGAPEPPVVVETIEVPGDVPAFYLRGTQSATRARMVFLHGRCTHGLGYVQAFQFTAARKGSVLALQGDQACDGTPFRRWSLDLDKINTRVEAALRAAGDSQPEAWRDMVVIGYSEGSSRAEALAQRWPERYSRVILIGAPGTPSAARLKDVRGAVMMAGDRDRQEHMKAGMRALQAIGVPATFISIPGAAHGGMGDGERVMGEALDWLWANAKPGAT